MGSKISEDLTERMEIRISKDQKKRALKMAKRNNCSIGSVFRKALDYTTGFVKTDKVICVALLLMASTVSADCTSLEGLQPKQLKAYHELEVILEDIKDISVGVKCLNRRTPKETQNDNQSRRTRNEQ